MEKTALLLSLYLQSASKRPSEASATTSSSTADDVKDVAAASVAQEHNLKTLQHAVDEVHGATRQALRSGRQQVRLALEGIDESSMMVAGTSSSSSSAAESGLLLAEAEIAAARASITALTEVVARLLAQADADRAVNPLAKTWKQRLGAAQRGTSSRSLLPRDAAAHVVEVLRELDRRLELVRQRVRLCRDEVAAAAQDLAYFSRFGVLAVKDEEIEELATKERARRRRSNTDAAGVMDDDDDRRPRFALTKGLAQRTMELVGGMEARVVREELNLAAHLPSTRPTAEEEEQLHQANMQLQQRQEASSTQEVASVARMIAELSEMTALMNRQVVEQNEQVSIVLQHTTQAQEHMQRAVEEVRKPAQSTWSPTRQRIALVWFSIVVLLLANWLMP